jgi:hypothetical protein
MDKCMGEKEGVSNCVIVGYCRYSTPRNALGDFGKPGQNRQSHNPSSPGL